jgi:methionyl aminopeptidase
VYRSPRGFQHHRSFRLPLLFCARALQVFTIEPMVNLGTWRDVLWPDGWTAATADGQRSAQFEHQLLITATGAEVLTARLPTSPPLWWEQEQ